MPDEKTHADALRFHLTGAVTAGGSQPDANHSLGHWYSSSEVLALGHVLVNSLSGIRIDHVSWANGTGNGLLESTTADTVAWTAPSGTQGAEVTIANGETKILEDGADSNKYVRVRRTSATDLSLSVCTVVLTEVYNNVIGMDNVESTEAASGLVSYRCVMVRNVSVLTLTNIKIWIDEDTAGLALGWEVPIGDGSLGNDQTGIGDGDEPAGVDWNTGTTAGTGLQLASLTAGSNYGLWIRRTISPGASASTGILTSVHWSFDTP